MAKEVEVDWMAVAIKLVLKGDDLKAGQAFEKAIQQVKEKQHEKRQKFLAVCATSNTKH